MVTNVRCTICSLVTDPTLGIQTLASGETLLEGYIEEVNDRVLGMLNTPTPSQTMQPQFKFLFTPKEVYIAETDEYTNLFEGLVDGALLKFTQYRHPKLKIWLDYSTIDTVYLVSAIRDADHLGSVKIATLKEQAV